jgi:hypothetical protein
MGERKPTSRRGGAGNASGSANRVAGADAKADSWLTCATYEFRAKREAGDFLFRFSAYDTSGARHSLELDNEADRHELAQDLYDALQIWPLVDIKFRSEKVAGAAYPQITAVQRLHPRA